MVEMAAIQMIPPRRFQFLKHEARPASSWTRLLSASVKSPQSRAYMPISSLPPATPNLMPTILNLTRVTPNLLPVILNLIQDPFVSTCGRGTRVEK